VVDVKVKTPGQDSGELGLGGFDFSQTLCNPNDLKCSGDMANVFNTQVHKKNSGSLASKSYREYVKFDQGRDLNQSFLSPQTLSLITKNTFGAPALAPKIDALMASIESWRLQFNCALYSEAQYTAAGLARPTSDCKISNAEPWRVMGDPATPILPVYEGDSTRIRLIQGSQEAQHVFTMNGVKWRRQPDVKNSGFVSAQPLGISEHFELDIQASPIGARRTDHLYFGSSIDQLWDGMWGIMRTYGRDPDVAGLPLIAAPGTARINQLAGKENPPTPSSNRDFQSKVCDSSVGDVEFDVSALRVCQLIKSGDPEKSDMDGICGEPAKMKGLIYNQRLNLSDPNAIVYLLLRKADGSPDKSTQSSKDVLTRLREHYSTRRLEPLVLRAPAGACINVKLRNMLKHEAGNWKWPENKDKVKNRLADLVDLKDLPMQDGPMAIDGQSVVEHYADNHMSMILDGFNYNQLKMSSSVGLSAPMVAQALALSDGSNVGVNSIEAGNNRGHEQGSLVPACRAQAQRESGNGCTAEYFWWAGDYQLDAQGKQIGKPVELGAVPLRSFGDVIKQPANGAIGALVIGPQGSKVCDSNDAAEKAADQLSYLSANICVPSSPDQKTATTYRDFVMVLQDAVDLKKDGWRMSNLKGAEEPDDYGAKAINYRSEPLWGRRGGDPDIGFDERNQYDYANALSSKCLRSDGSLVTPDPSGNNDACSFAVASAQALLTEAERKAEVAKTKRQFSCQAQIPLLYQAGRGACDPETPIFVAKAGAEVRLRIVHPGGHTRQQGITLHGHKWSPYPWKDESRKLIANSNDAVTASWTIQGTYNAIGPMMAANLLFQAGGSNRISSSIPGDYLFRSQASFVFDGGAWGILRVLP
jgi:manganese oxidase